MPTLVVVSCTICKVTTTERQRVRQTVHVAVVMVPSLIFSVMPCVSRAAIVCRQTQSRVDSVETVKLLD